MKFPLKRSSNNKNFHQKFCLQTSNEKIGCGNIKCNNMNLAGIKTRLASELQHWLSKYNESKIHNFSCKANRILLLCNFPTKLEPSASSSTSQTKDDKEFFLLLFSWLILGSFCSIRKLKTHPNPNPKKKIASIAKHLSSVLILFNTKTEKSNFTPAIRYLGDFHCASPLCCSLVHLDTTFSSHQKKKNVI